MDIENSVFVKVNTANDGMEIVRELRATGLVQGTDFNFHYMPVKLGDDYEIVSHKGIRVIFKDSKWATFFRIKYGNN
jgi:hypothetical protein